MSEIQEKINSIIKETVEENDAEDKVSELNFSQKGFNIGQLTTAMKSAIQTCPNVDFLGLSECGLNSLDNLPNLLKLETIDLKGNQLDDSQIKKLKELKQLKQLYIQSNKIDKLETLEELAKTLSSLTTLQVGNNPVAEIDGFTEAIWRIFPNLSILNEHDKEGNKVQDEPEVDDEEEDSKEEQDYDGEDESHDSAFSQADYESENEKPKKQRKTK